MTNTALPSRFVHLTGTLILLLAVADALALNLANEPLFVTVPVKPNVILAVDDSGSMDSEVLLPTNDGALWWHSESESFVGLDRNDELSPGTINYNYVGAANEDWKKYVYLFPIGEGLGRRIYTDQTNDHYAVPPRPEFAFTRAAEYNKAYYDPLKHYEPWPSSYGQTFGDSNPAAAPTDPVIGAATLNLTQEITSGSDQWTFRLQPGMRDANGDLVVDDEENGTFTYFPATYYSMDTSGACAAPLPADYTAFVANPALLPGGVDAIAPDGHCLIEHQIKTGSSFPSGRTYEAELQNFANWFTYHRKRHQAMRGGILSAFSRVSGIRTSAFGFNELPDDLNILDLDTQRTDFFDGLKDLVRAGGTPTREALDYIGETLERTDGSAPITLKCQKNFAILFTDGFAVPNSIDGIDNEDGLSGVPYADGFDDTLGDVAMHYYQNNARPDLTTGQVPVSNACRRASPNPLLDCNKNLHMVTYAVGLGVEGTLFGNTHTTRADAHSVPPVWLEPNIDRNPVQVDDLYHATVNGRGDLLNATTPDGIAENMNQVLSSILDAISSASSVAANSTSVNTGSQVFQSRFHSSTWRGQLLAFTIDRNGSIPVSYLWDAGAVLSGQTAASRKILTVSRDTNDGIPFRWAGIASQTDTLHGDLLNTDAFGTSDGLGSQRVNYLRGDATTGFRVRNNKLGDIIHSSPLYVGRPQAGYVNAAYGTFASNLRDRERVIYVGANDGMLHGFNATTGAEVIAYVPGSVYPNLSRLTDPDYGETLLPHRFYVDGSPMAADVQVNANWMTVLAGGLNRGGQGYYALDISDPSLFAETNSAAANTVLWEFTDANDPDLGYTYNGPVVNYDTWQSAQIAKMNNGKWALIVGNGYNNTEADGHASATGHAALFIIYIEGGADGTWSATDYTKIDTGAGSLVAPNGLATPAPIDIDGDGDVDIAYAGDLEGNIWKFNLTDASASNWTTGLLYAAVDAGGNPQPITTAVMTLHHPNGGFVVGFGSGQYLELADLSTTAPQTLYGIWDSALGGSVATVTGGRASLVEQSVLAVTRVANTDYRVTSNNAVDFSTKKGWYMDL
ncbi:MAG: PilC/PilY family type IV pilus protein, partial [Thiohalocapsa sp.]